MIVSGKLFQGDALLFKCFSNFYARKNLEIHMTMSSVVFMLYLFRFYYSNDVLNR